MPKKQKVEVSFSKSLSLLFFAVTAGIAIAVISFVSIKLAPVAIAELQNETNVSNDTGIVAVRQPVVGFVSFEDYITNKTMYNKQLVSVLGKLGIESQINAGVNKYYVADDYGNKLYLQKLSLANLVLFKDAGLRTYNVTGVFRSIYSDPVIEVRSIN